MFLKKGEKTAPLANLPLQTKMLRASRWNQHCKNGTNSPLQPNKFLQGCWIKSWQSQPSTSFNNLQQDLPAVELLLVNVWTATPSPKDRSMGRTRPSSQFLRNTRNSRNVIKFCPLSTFFESKETSNSDHSPPYIVKILWHVMCLGGGARQTNNPLSQQDSWSQRRTYKIFKPPTAA